MTSDQHGKSLSNRSNRVLFFALGLTALFFVIEVIGAYLTNSLALLADAGHMLTDVVALGIALAASRLARRPHSQWRSYGYHRLEILAALLNGQILLLVLTYITFEALSRIQSPPSVDALPLLVVAFLGLVINLGSGAVIYKSSMSSLNVRAAFLHVVADAGGSLGVLLAGVLIFFFDWNLADPLISLLISLLLLVSSSKLVWGAIHILLEGTPSELNLQVLSESIHSSPDVQQVHDIHAWSLTSGYNAMTAHVVLRDGVSLSDREVLLDGLHHMIRDQFAVQHSTIQLEESSHCCEELHGSDETVFWPTGLSIHDKSEQ